MSRTKTSWGAMHSSSSPSPQQATTDHTSPQQLLWKPRGQQHISQPPPEAGAFPALGPSITPDPPSTHAANSSQHQRQPGTGGTAGGTPGGLARRRSLSAPSLPAAAAAPQQYSAVAGRSGRAGSHNRSSSVDRPTAKHSTPAQHRSPAQQQPQQQHQQQQQPQPQPHQQLESGLQLLQECHPWCEAVMLHEVLQAFGGDVVAALEALQQMVPAGGPGSSCSDGSNSDSSSEQAAKPAAKVSGSAAVDAGLLQSRNWPAGPEETEQLVGDTAAGGRQRLHLKDSSRQQQQQQQHAQADLVGQDTYRVLRGDAVKLSHKYRKASKRAAVARSQGDFSAAAQLAAEAAALKAAADAAHAAAALKIEVTNNAQTPYGLWELDLHGLHVSEALQSLQERVQLLRDIAQDLRKTAAAAGVSAAAPLPAQPPSAAAAPGRRHPHAALQQGSVRPAGSSTKQAVLTSLLLPDDSVLSWEQQLAALRQELRVIVGKGLHSSGGEASLPRVVEQWLLRQGYKYVWREGSISVQLRLL